MHEDIGLDIKVRDGIAILRSPRPLITDGQSALDLLATIGYWHRVQRIALEKTVLSEDFFRLSTGIAGEVAQKFVNYGFRAAIWGDFSGYTSPALKDYLRESNQGRHLCFVSTLEEALERLGG